MRDSKVSGESVTAFIISDRPSTAMHLRQVLVAQGRDCPPSHLIPPDHVKRMIVPDSAEALFLIAVDNHDLSLSLIRQVRSQVAGRVICVGIPAEPRVVLDALHAGADDYVDESAEVESQINDVVMRLDSQRRKNRPAGRLVAVTSASGGAGCTFLTVNLAIALARRGNPSILIDLASEHGEISEHLNLKPKFTLGDLLHSVDSLDHEIFNQSLTAHESGISVLGGLPDDDRDHIHQTDFERVTRIARLSQPLTLLDVNRREIRRLNLPSQVDLIVLLVRLDFPALCNARRLLDEWYQQGVDPSHIVIVANRSNSAAEIPANKADSFLRRTIDFCLSDDAINANVSVNCGVPLMIEAPRCKLATQIESLAGHLMPSQHSAEEKPRTDQSLRPIASLFRLMSSITT